MDWPRAKTILIVCFLALNLFISYDLYIQPVFRGISDSLSPDRFDSIMNVLNQNGMDIQMQLPRSTPLKAFIRVAVNPYSEGEIIILRDRVLGPTASRISENALPTEESAVNYLLGAEELVVTSLGYVSYYNRALFAMDGAVTSDEARQMADQFLQEKLGAPQDFTYDSTSFVDSMGMKVEYVQIHEEFHIFPARIVVMVNPSGVVAAWVYRLRVTSVDANQKPIQSAAEALLNLLSHRFTVGAKEALTVYEMELGYYSRLYDTLDPWPAAPVWRVRTNAGDFFVNAHSGVVEE
jgi:regulatory protein YycI of two-component signal transduction system YycFG